MSEVKVPCSYVENIANAYIARIHASRKADFEKVVDDLVRPRWWHIRKRDRAVEAAALIKRCNESHFGCSWQHRSAMWERWCENLIKACTLAADPFILLSVSDAAQLKEWEDVLKN